MKTIVKGADEIVTVRLVEESTGEPYDLSAADEITARFLKSDGTALEKTMGDGEIAFVGNAVLGKITITLTDTDTSGLEVSDSADLELRVDTGANRKSVLLEGCLKVRAGIAA